MQTRRNLYLITAFLSLLVSCEIVEPEAKKDLVEEDPIEETEEEEVLDLFYGSGDMGLFQDEENMIMLGSENGTNTFTRLYRINKNGVLNRAARRWSVPSLRDWKNLSAAADRKPDYVV